MPNSDSQATRWEKKGPTTKKTELMRQAYLDSIRPLDPSNSKDRKILEQQREFTYVETGSEAPVVIGPLSRLPECFGAFATSTIKKNTVYFYGGELKKIPARRHAPYAFHLSADNQVWDAQEQGNSTRFFNHSHYFPNFSVAKSNRSICPIQLVALRDILPGEQLLFDYGHEYNTDGMQNEMIVFHPGDSLLSSLEELCEESLYLKTPETVSLNSSSESCFVTPLHAAILRHDTATVKSLLSKEFSFKLVSLPLIASNTQKTILYHDKEDGITPMILAIMYDFPEGVRALLAWGETYKIDLANRPCFQRRDLPLAYALTLRKQECADALLKKLKNHLVTEKFLRYQNEQDETLIHLSIPNKENNRNLRKLLDLHKKHNVDPFIFINKENLCPLWSSIKHFHENPDAFLMLISFIKKNEFVSIRKDSKEKSSDTLDRIDLYVSFFISQLEKPSFRKERVASIFLKLKNHTTIFENKTWRKKFFIHLFSELNKFDQNKSSTSRKSKNIYGALVEASFFSDEEKSTLDTLVGTSEDTTDNNTETEEYTEEDTARLSPSNKRAHSSFQESHAKHHHGRFCFFSPPPSPPLLVQNASNHFSEQLTSFGIFGQMPNSAITATQLPPPSPSSLVASRHFLNSEQLASAGIFGQMPNSAITACLAFIQRS